MNTVIHAEIQVGQTITIGDTVVTLADKSGRKARLTIVGPRETRIKLPNRAQERASRPTTGKELAHG